MESCLYTGWVKHRRFRPVRHEFRYRLFLVCLDLTDLDAAFAHSWTWSHRRPNLAWFRRGDHIGDPNQPLDQAVRDLIESSGRTRPSGRILLLTHLRYLGVVFNPVSFYFCLDQQGQWETMVAAVTNTPWRQVHCYIVDRAQTEKGPLNPQERLSEKALHVSPFLGMEFGYRWDIKFTDETLAIHIENVPRDDARSESSDLLIESKMTAENRAFNVTMSLKKRALNRKGRWSALLLYPWMTVAVVLAIYWQALRLWWKGVPYVPHPDKVVGRPVGPNA